jgi:hypothetical protein
MKIFKIIQRTMGGKVSISAEALVIMSSKPSNNESERVA